MLLFVTAVSVVLIVSFLCSIFESVLLSLTRPQVEILVRKKKRAGKLLARFKANMDIPIAAILILNTAAHTIGAAVAGVPGDHQVGLQGQQALAVERAGAADARQVAQTRGWFEADGHGDQLRRRTGCQH